MYKVFDRLLLIFFSIVGKAAAHLEEISSNVRKNTAASLATPTHLPFSLTNGFTRPMVNSKPSQLNQITEQINRGYKVLIILRGLPGSGKSYLARKIVEISIGSHDYHNFIFSADDFFIRRGTYQYDPSKLQDAHTFNQQRAYNAMKRGVSPIIIDNTNTQMWEMKPYAMVSAQYAYIIEILEPDTPWAFNDRELFRRNVHGVPRVKLKEMLMRYERDITPAKVVRDFNIRYGKLLPPQLRSFPPLVNANNANIVEESVVDKVVVGNVEQKSIAVDDENLSHDGGVMSKPKVNAIPAADLSLWGVSETALHSWDVCTPVNANQTELKTMNNDSEMIDEVIETADAATNTSINDFALLTNPTSDVKVLITNCRDINEHLFCSTLSIAPRKKIVVDKSCMVGEDLIEQRMEKKDALEQLSAVFPSIPHIYLREIYDKCQGDLNWSIDLLCDDNLHNLLTPQELPVEIEPEQNEPVVEKQEIIQSQPEEKTVAAVSEAEREQLKRLLEEKIVIRDDFYSEHTLKLKSKTLYDQRPAQPSTSRVQKIATDAGNVIAVDSDVDMDDFDLETASESNGSNGDPQEMMELNLGETFITELESKLQEPTLQYPKGFLPIVQVPVAMARQLYALYIESVYQQMDAQNEVLDMLVKEDEEFAKKLQAQEAQPHQPEPTTIPEIMQEQHQLMLSRKEVEQWKNLTPDDFAAKMTKKKLFESFPNIAQNVLVELWQAHQYNYKDTVESIMASSPEHAAVGGDGKLEEPPVAEEIVGEMREAYNQVIIFLLVKLQHFYPKRTFC